MEEALPKHDVVLLGVGHTNAHVLRMWKMRPIADARLTCVSDFGVATYSGMLPGTLAGQYRPEEMQIDLVRLCAAAGARLILGEVTGLDALGKRLILADRPPLRYDVLSIGIGSIPAIPAGGEAFGLAIKPMQTFLRRLDARVDQRLTPSASQSLHVVIVGGGAAGVEIAFCLPRRIRTRYPAVELRITLVSDDDQLLPNMPGRTRTLAREELRRRDVELILGKKVTSATNGGRLLLEDDGAIDSDLVIWATSATSPSLLGNMGLATDDRGFLLTCDTLQSVSSDAVFAVGDTGTVDGQPRPKAGVFAVRQGPVLWDNLQRQLRGQPLIRWRPQRSFLTLLNSGDGRALLAYKGQSLHAAWCWRLKDFIDRRFMAKYQDYQPMSMSSSASDDRDRMYCGGCGCKLPGDLLSRALGKLDNPTPSHVLIGLAEREDVAALQLTPRRAVAVTADFFTAFINDPFLLGRVAALNALSDVFAKGAQPLGALALVTVPHGPAIQQEDFLTQLLAGSLHEFRPLDVPLVGGHTTEGPLALAGFTVLGEVDPAQITAKNCLQVGDYLVLTKPLGTGILLAGHMRAMCRHDWFASLLESMLSSNQPVAQLATQVQITAATDVTGFGLAGHLLEMLRASNTSAELWLDQIPLLPGAAELIEAGVESSLAPGNRANAADVDSSASLNKDPRYNALFDPQTSGGLLMGVPEAKLSLLQNSWRNPPGLKAAVVGRVIHSPDHHPKIYIGAEAAQLGQHGQRPNKV